MSATTFLAIITMGYLALDQITEHVSVENVFANLVGRVLIVHAEIALTLVFHHVSFEKFKPNEIVSLIALCITQKKAKFVLVKETVFVVNANVLRKTVADTLANTARNAQYEP